MGFRLQKERQEADRKRIEAQGIHDFQQIVAQGISPQLLQWKGIEATETLAKSSNTKIVVIGNTKTGLPLVMAKGPAVLTLPFKGNPPLFTIWKFCAFVWPMRIAPKLRLAGVTESWAGG